VEPKYSDITIDLIGQDGNAFAIIGRVSKILKKAGVEQEEIVEFREQAMSGDYDNLLKTVGEWVNIE
jgi:hypothetical protein